MSMAESAAEKIGRRLDEIAAELVPASENPATPDRWAASISALADLAQSLDYPQIAGLANTLAGRVHGASASGTHDELRSTLTRGLNELRIALEFSEPAEAASSGLGSDPELVGDFVSESREHLESIESQVLTLEREPSNLEAIHSIFRSFHTIKGLAGFLEFDIIRQLAHEVETVLDLARNKQLAVSSEVIDVILESNDYLARWNRSLDAALGLNRPPSPAPDGVLLSRIHGLIHGESKEEAVPTTVEAQPLPSELSQSQKPESKVAARSVKVDTDKLDHLVDMVSEMVIAQSLVRHDPDLKLNGNARIQRNLAQLARITDEVQRTAMAMRTVPIGALFQKMVRLVRDLGKRFGKQIHVETEGEDVDLDRNIVEELADPLMHMIRNAVDHGIETPDERRAAGKNPSARVRLRAFHRSGQVVIEVSDDGRGINRKKVIERARKNGLISATAQISDADCHNLIFQPGFSTAEKVSDVSGRGVGMDVVRKQILKLRGSIDLNSTEGQGTVFSLRLPLTLAIIDGLVVATGGERHILPLASIKEIFRPVPEQVSTIEGRAEVVSVRDKLTPVLRLHDKFGIEPKTRNVCESVFVMVELDGMCFCIMVDELVGKQEVVIKSLGSVFRDVPGIAGGAILGDGKVGLILDLQTLFSGKHDARSAEHL